MDELFPIIAGLAFGVAFAHGHRLVRWTWVKAALVLLTGVSATLASGEYRDNWGFVVVDIGEVALAAWIASYLWRVARRFLVRGQSGKLNARH